MSTPNIASCEGKFKPRQEFKLNPESQSGEPGHKSSALRQGVGEAVLEFSANFTEGLPCGPSMVEKKGPPSLQDPSGHIFARVRLFVHAHDRVNLQISECRLPAPLLMDIILSHNEHTVLHYVMYLCK